MSNKFYITTTLPYVNSDPHIGFAAEIVKADCIARWQALQGKEIFFNTGTDEHGLKIYRKAAEAGVDPLTYCDGFAAKFKGLKEVLNLSVTNFIRTTDEHHVKAAQEFWKKCDANGDIYKKTYQVKYCVGCELEKTDSELNEAGRCPLHPNADLELINEENYFFRFSKYQKPLLELYEKNLDFVQPRERLNEIKAFVARGLEDFSISRLASKMPWGVSVPGDESQVMYVWFDALVNYISCLGWPNNTPRPSTGTPLDRGDLFSEFWPGVQVCGKDNLRQQTAMWQSMLMSAGLPTSKQVLVFGFITADGQKMSKSLGNVINPYDLVAKYGVDATRYFLLREIKPFTDSDFSFEKLETLYNAELANGIGNLAARVSNLLEKNQIETNLSFRLFTSVIPSEVEGSLKDGEIDFKGFLSDARNDKQLFKDFIAKMDEYAFDEAIGVLIKKAADNDVFLAEKKPWKMEDKEDIKKVLEPVAQDILDIAYLLAPFMPATSEKLIKQFSEKQIKKGESLFPRLVAEVKK